MFYKLLLSICIIKEQESFKPRPLNTPAHRGCESRHRPSMLIRLIAIVIHIKRTSSGPSMTSLLKAPGYHSSNTLYGCAFKTRSGANSQTATHLFGARKQTWKVDWSPQSAPVWGPNLKAYQITHRFRNPRLTCFQRESIKKLFISEWWHISQSV